MSAASPLPLERARAIVLERIPALGSEDIPLGSALGRTLSVDVVSAGDLPGYDSSAMDGFAVRAADTSPSAVTLVLAGESRAGHPSSRALGPGQAMRISTGAALPAGADAVVRVEDADDRGDAVCIMVAVEPGHDVRPRGDAIARGERVLAAGTDVGAAELGVLAATGNELVRCVTPPRLALLTTGDELRPAGAALKRGQIWNSNVHAIAAQARLAGAQVTTDHVGDDADATREALARALDGNDLVVVCGGVSVGQHDHVRPALAALGVDEGFWRVALRPGKPTWFGRGSAGRHARLRAARQPRLGDGHLRAVRAPGDRRDARSSADEADRLGDLRCRVSEAAWAAARDPLPARRTRRRLARDAHRPAGIARAHLDGRRRRAGADRLRTRRCRGRRARRDRAAVAAAGPLTSAVRTSSAVVAGVAGDRGDRVLEHGRDDAEQLLDGARAARQVDHDRAAGYTADCAAEHAHRRVLQ